MLDQLRIGKKASCDEFDESFKKIYMFSRIEGR